MPFLGRYCPNPRQSGDAPLRSELELSQMKLRSFCEDRGAPEGRGQDNDAQNLFAGRGGACPHPGGAGLRRGGWWRRRPRWSRCSFGAVGGGRGSLGISPGAGSIGHGSFTGNLGSSGIGHGGASFSTGSYGSMGHLDIGHGDIGLNLTLVVPGKRVIPPGCPEASGVLRCFRQWILGHDTHERKD